MTRNLPQINVRHQTTDPGSSRTTKYNKCQIRNKPSTCWHIIFKQQKIKNKGKKKKEANRCREWTGGHNRGRRGWDELGEQHWPCTQPSGEEAASGAAARPRAWAALTLYTTIWRRGGQWGCWASQGASSTDSVLYHLEKRRPVGLLCNPGSSAQRSEGWRGLRLGSGR